MALSFIFDMDGTLFQTDTILELSLEDAFNQLRLRHEWDAATPIDQFRNIMGAPLPEVWQTLLPNHSIKAREQTDAFFQEQLINNITRGKGALYPNVKEVLSYLNKNGCSIFIASNGLTEYLKAIVDYYRLDHWVTETFSIQQIESLNKSDLVQSIIGKYNIHHAAVVGDRLSDIKAAKDNGLISIGCRFDFAIEKELVQADVVINDLIELKEISNKYPDLTH